MKTKIVKVLNELSYRSPMEVTETLLYKSIHGDSVHGTWLGFAVCPKCKKSMERDYQLFCDRYGQKLSWKKYGYANTTLRFAGDKSGKTYKYIIKAKIKK